MAEQAAPVTVEQMQQMQRQLEEMQRRMQEQEAAREAVPIPINQMFTPVLNHGQVSGPGINANNFELKSGLVGMVRQHQYGGHKTENPNTHLQQFLEVCSTNKMNGVSDDAIRLRLFSFSLRDAAKDWYHSLDLSTVDSWECLAHKFLHKFFPPGLTLKLKGEITQFRQFDDETLYEAWERFRNMLRKCPNHGFGVDHQVCIFYNGCDMEMKRLVDASAGGSLLNKGHDQVVMIIEDMATNSYQWTGDRQVKILKRATIVDDSDPISKIVAQLSTLNATINSKFDAMSQQTVNLSMNQAVEDVNSHMVTPTTLQPPPGFLVTNGVINEEKKPNIDDLLIAFMRKTDKFMGESQARVEKLKNIVGAMSVQMKMFKIVLHDLLLDSMYI